MSELSAQITRGPKRSSARQARLRPSDRVRWQTRPRPGATDAPQMASRVAWSHETTLFKLAIAAECRDLDTSCHMIRVGQLSGLIALRLTGDRQFADLMSRAAPMHDIGKLAIADSILKKPGPLTSEEWVHMRTHADIGERLLRQDGSRLLSMASEIARHHHERFDGSGYPDRLSGDDIPLSARIAAAADYYDALTNKRCYHDAQPHLDVVRSIVRLGGSHFDPRVVATLERCADEALSLAATVNQRFAGRRLFDLDESAFNPLFA